MGIKLHISDGILSPVWVLIWFSVAFLFVAIGITHIRKKTKENPSYMPMLALMGASIFVISVWHIPVPVTGSCSHPIGTPMSAIIVGPFQTVVLSFIALFFHIFLGHGGLTTLGANTFSMGIVGTFTGYLTYKAFRKLGASIWLSAGIAGFIGDVLTYITTAFELAISLHPESFMYYWKIFSIGFVPTQIPLALLEFAFTSAVMRYVSDLRPEFLIEKEILEVNYE
ncbi:MAG: energy-coupling factor ABC transporter permease [Candidatus Hydrothermarchaeota archaeon]